MAHNDMVENLNIKQFASLNQRPGNSNIVGAGRRVTRGVVMNNDNARRIALKRGAKDLAHPDLGRVHRSLVHICDAQHHIFCIQHDDAQVFHIEGTHIATKHSGIAR